MWNPHEVSQLDALANKNNYIVKMGGAGSRAPYKANPEKVKYLPNGEITIKI